jgi:hypothetical protein
MPACGRGLRRLQLNQRQATFGAKTASSASTSPSRKIFASDLAFNANARFKEAFQTDEEQRQEMTKGSSGGSISVGRANNVFIIHGHGDAAKAEVPLLIDRAGLKPR